MRTVGQGGGKASTYEIYPLHNSCNFDTIRFLNILSGYPNNISVDFGSTVVVADGDFVKDRENPIIAFREAWILQTDFVDEEKRSKTLIVRRSMYKPENYHLGRNDRIFCNPTGLNAKFIERYWGCNADIWQLTARKKTIMVVNQDGTRETHEVPNKHALFSERFKAFYDWIRTPRNWYWDQKTGHFYVFTFAADMVEMEVNYSDWGELFMQQMVCYNVSLFYWHNRETQDMFESYLMDRQQARETWEKLEEKYKFPPDLSARMRKEEKLETFVGTGYSQELCKEVDDYYDTLTTREPEVRKSFVDYYQRVLSYVVHSPPVVDGEGNITMPPPSMTPNERRQSATGLDGMERETNSITDAVGLLGLVGRQQLQTRHFFWRLFEEKFGFPYHEFLSSREKCTEVLHMCPEAFGPKCYGPTDNVNEGTLFRDAFKKTQDRETNAEPPPFSRFFLARLPELTPVDKSQERVDRNNRNIAALHFVDPPSADELLNLEMYYLKHATVHFGGPTRHADEREDEERNNRDSSNSDSDD